MPSSYWLPHFVLWYAACELLLNWKNARKIIFLETMQMKSSSLKLFLEIIFLETGTPTMTDIKHKTIKHEWIGSRDSDRLNPSNSNSNPFLSLADHV
jgi:hypothetical protein